MKNIVSLISKYIYIFVFLFVFCHFNISYASSTGTVYLSSDKSAIEKGEEIEITLLIENAKTAAFTSYLYFDDLKLDYISGPDNTNMIENRIIYVWYDQTGGNIPKDKELAKFKFKAKENGICKFYIKGEFYNKEGELIQINYKDIEVQVGKEETKLEKEVAEEQSSNSQISNATLQVLRLDKEGITPNFEKDIYQYYLTISNEINKIEVLAISENSNANVEITGNTNLKEGLNFINIKVTSEDKKQSNLYTIQVTKTNNLDFANTNLEILAIENILLNPPFEASITHYNVEVPNDTTKLNILAVPENENAVVQISEKENLKEGNNLIKVTVTAQNGFSNKVYEINAYRRTSEEENKYKEEQEVNKEKLEEIYKIQNANNQSEEFVGEVENENKKESQNNKIILGLIIAFIVVILGILKIKKEKIK